ncbi:LysR family glycine cleavage system transcriptional activator [Pseudomonas sp. SJZ079]|uniref:LysR substrate-binding domain-containing protein n=1 Tax=Pseudomonas sp. SJZ079 TaxID=2572887 RepID=UPI001199681B|nr:LysR substrate-binding domain-containing protein [Pseudomonas sp. SJZ079]TWC30810.1 LysR family glycine cleavage system transcriptional activator [Pseudomonas sp. SJZ079]
MRQPNLNSLRMFDAAARQLNFRLAAEELNLTQGAVAQQVRRLEADLGVQLFYRNARGLALTETGRSYHAPVRRALALIDEATQKLRPENTRVTLSVTPSFASKWLVPRLAAFARAHPDIEVQVMANEGLANFQSDGVDLAIRQGRAPFAESLHVELLAPLELHAVCSPGFAAELGPIERLEDCIAQPLIQDGHNLWASLFEDAGLTARRRFIQFNQTALAMDAAAHGQGIALAPRLLLNVEFEHARLVELWRDTRANQGGYYVLYPRERELDPARDALINWLLAEARATQAEP